MNIFAEYRSRILQIVDTLVLAGKLPAGMAVEAVEVSPPREASHGDLATNVAMVLASKAAMKPRDIAELMLVALQSEPGVAKVEIAGPGFINITLKPEMWQGILPVVLKEGIAFGNSAIGNGVRANVEYVSANPTGPMHVGHGRGAVVGDALAMLLIKAGYSVTKEYYVNDAGAQVQVLCDSVMLRYQEALGEDIGEIPAGLYPGDYLKAVGEGLAKAHGDDLLKKPKEVWYPIVREYAVSTLLAMIKEDLALLGIHHDVFASEYEITKAGRVDEAVEVLRDKGLVYVGVLEPPKGKVVEDWEPRPQTLFKSSQFGDDVDRALKKSDGSWTYFAPDIAYHYDKYKRGHDVLIDIFGADHGGYVKRIKAVVEALSDGKCKTDVKLCQLVKLLRNGEPVKMSKRAGTFVTLKEVVEEVGKDVFRFIMLTRKNDASLDFDFAKVTEQSKDNPVFYVQYAHARCKSVLRMAREDMGDAVTLSEKPNSSQLSLLSSPSELELIRLLAGWPRLVEQAATAFEPHRVAFYLQEVAAAFHGYWNKGNEDVSLRFILKDDLQKTIARLALVRVVATVIASGLWVLGVEPVEEMR
jgi:arginyl-tRNA synthetase